MRVGSSCLTFISLVTVSAYAATTPAPAANPAPSLNSPSAVAPAVPASTTTTKSTATTTPAAPSAPTTTTTTTTAPAMPAESTATFAPANVMPANAVDVSGRYRCEGNDYTGKSPYVSPAIVNKSGDTFSFQWLNANGYPYNLGTGIYNKNVGNMMAVVFWDPQKPDQFGTLIYQIQSDGTLVGNWVYEKSNQVGTETCTKMK